MIRAASLSLAVLVCACGESRDEPARDPVAEPAAAVAEPVVADEIEGPVGLGAEERRRLEKQYAAEAVEQITAENAAALGQRLLDQVERELAAELSVAVDAGTD